MRADFNFANHGSICLLTPLTDEALDWVSDNLPEDVMTWGGGIAIEPRYVQPILHGLDDDGLTVAQIDRFIDETLYP